MAPLFLRDAARCLALRNLVVLNSTQLETFRLFFLTLRALLLLEALYFRWRGKLPAEIKGRVSIYSDKFEQKAVAQASAPT